jgi:hypothetical protein
LTFFAPALAVIVATVWFWRRYGGNALTVAATAVSAVIGILGLLWAISSRQSSVAQSDTSQFERADRRRIFARNVEDQLRLSSSRDWDDERYAELAAETEIEAAGPDWQSRWHTRLPFQGDSLRRERSLTRALLRARQQLIVMEGEPGSGKSVALRHLALHLARRAQRPDAGTDSPIPLYINLKSFRPERRPVDSESVRQFIYETLTRVNDRDVERFVDDEFDAGLRAGTWLLLFDSFDEIPDILGATDSGDVVLEYAQALITFVRNRQCKAVIASREFRGPPSFRLPRFRVVPLNERQQRDLISRSGLPPALADTAVANIAQAGPVLHQMANNPLFLWLICDYLRNTGDFPDNSYIVFASYVGSRIETDATRIREHFGLSTEYLRTYAEELAFLMAATPSLGLSATYEQLSAAVGEAGRLNPSRVGPVLKALTYLKLGRTDEEPGEPGNSRFTFTHRRMQEYFATCVVLREPDRVPLEQILTDGHWRETAVAILQTQSADASGPLLDTAQQLLAGTAGPDATQDEPAFGWPPGLLHLLEVIAAGLGRTPERIPAQIRAHAGQVLSRAWRSGRRHDQLWVLSVARTAPDAVMSEIMADAFESPSSLLRQAAYRQASWLAELPEAVVLGIRWALFALWASGEFRQRSVVVKAQLRRFQQGTALLSVYWLLRVIIPLDLLLLTVVGALVFAAHRGAGNAIPVALPVVICLAVAHISLLLRRNALAASMQLRPRPSAIVQWHIPEQKVTLWVRVLARALRLFCAGLIGWDILALSGPLAVKVLGGLAVLYVVMWADVAMDQVLAGTPVPARAWPLLPLRWARPRRARVFDSRIGHALEEALWVAGTVAIAAPLLGVPWLLVKLLGLLPLAPLLHWLARHFPWAVAGLGVAFLIGIAIYLLVQTYMVVRYSIKKAFFVTAQITRQVIKMLNRRHALRDAKVRTDPYDVAEIITALSDVSSARGVRELVRHLRLTPQLCPPEVIGLLSDMATAAELGGSVPYGPGSMDADPLGRSIVSIPPGAGAPFTDWATHQPARAATLLVNLDDEAIDEITKLVAAQRKP